MHRAHGGSYGLYLHSCSASTAAAQSAASGPAKSSDLCRTMCNREAHQQHQAICQTHDGMWVGEHHASFECDVASLIVRRRLCDSADIGRISHQEVRIVLPVRLIMLRCCSIWLTSQGYSRRWDRALSITSSGCDLLQVSRTGDCARRDSNLCSRMLIS